MNKLKFHDFLKTKNKKIHWPYKIPSIYKITPLSTQRKGWSIYWEEERALFVYLRYIISLCK